MNTYMVEVNNHFLVRIEIDGSACAAEHYFLDGFKCVWGALAYDTKTMKTDCFRAACLNDELISLDLLEEKLRKVDDAADEVRAVDEKLQQINAEIERLAAQRDDLIQERSNAKQHYGKLFERCNCQSR